MNEEIEKLLSAMTNIEARLGQLSTVEETAKVKAELAELSKKQLGLAEEIRRLKQQQPGGSDNVSAPLTLGARVVPMQVSWSLLPAKAKASLLL